MLRIDFLGSMRHGFVNKTCTNVYTWCACNNALNIVWSENRCDNCYKKCTHFMVAFIRFRASSCDYSNLVFIVRATYEKEASMRCLKSFHGNECVMKVLSFHAFILELPVSCIVPKWRNTKILFHDEIPIICAWSPVSNLTLSLLQMPYSI